MADSDGEYVADDGSDEELVAPPEHVYGTRGATAANGSSGLDASGRPRGGPAGGSGAAAGSRRKKKKKAGKAAWEDLQRSWDVVVESEDGNLSLAGLGLEAEKRRRLLRDTTPIQRGIIRHLVLVIDMSFAMAEKDLLPSRYRLAISYSVDFVREYFEQNPISQLAVVGMREGLAVRVSDMSGNPAEHIARIRALEGQDPAGNPSLQNALEMCRGALYNTPSHGTREVLIIFGALLSSDPGDIYDTIDNLVADRIRVSVIGLAAQVYICETLCRRTNAAGAGAATKTAPAVPPPAGGESTTYMVAMHELHFRELLLAATQPPATLAGAGPSQQEKHSSQGASLLMMGFPSRTASTDPALCACHNRPTLQGYSCTRCGTRVCRLPAECPACGLTLILSTHLARSYHHLFPLRSWVEVGWADALRSGACFSCLAPFPDARGKAPKAATDRGKGKGRESAQYLAVPTASTSNGGSASASPRQPPADVVPKGVSESGRYMCPVCRQHFCIDCDVYAHDVIHNCPGCQSDTRYELAAEANGKGKGNGVDNGSNGAGAMVIDDL